jgi:hypothetical protein
MGSQVVVLDSGRPAGVPAEQWQQRASGLDRQFYRVIRQHFDVQELADEIGGNVLFPGASTSWLPRRPEGHPPYGSAFRGRVAHTRPPSRYWQIGSLTRESRSETTSRTPPQDVG